MIEVRKIREYSVKGTTRKADKPFAPEIYVENIHKIFDSLPEIVEKIPESERFNCFYTLGHAPAGKSTPGRKWEYQEVIPFDIDNCDYVDDSPDPRYLDAVSTALGIDTNKCIVVATGNGLQILVKPKHQITDVKWFDTHSRYYQALCDKLKSSLQDAGLKGEPDPTAFQPNRLFRLPATRNVKPGKPDRKAQVLTGNLETLDFDLKVASGLPAVADDEAISEKELSYYKLDHSAIESGCDFLKWAKGNQSKVTEPQWYALLSIVGRISSDSAHSYSLKHPSYSKTETDRKLRQALDASGPRTCDNIQRLWGKCKSCPNYKKVNSPIVIRGPDFIATSDTGFHQYDPKKRTLTPQYVDLLRFYDQKNPFLNAYGSHYQWNKTHWLEVPDEKIDSFAQQHFAPACNNTKAAEFRGIIKRTNIKEAEFFTETTKGKINLKNGTLDLATMTLSPPSTSIGFRYCLPFAYDPIATAPLFEKMLSDVTCGNDSLQKILLEYMGYCLAGDDPYAQKFLLLTGEGANGKSALVKILDALGGSSEGGARSLSDSQLASPHDSVLLDGALFNITEEVPKHLNSEFWERLKAFTTGAKVTASKKFKSAYSFWCRAKFVLVTNDLPKGGNPSTGLFRRFLIVPFNATFSTEKGNLQRGIENLIIQTELPGVLNMAIEGYQRLKNNNYEFTQSDLVNDTIEEYKLDADNVSRWCSENVVAFKDNQEPTATWMKLSDNKDTWGNEYPYKRYAAVIQEMRSAYEVWVRVEGENPVSVASFTHRLKRYLKDKKIPHEFGHSRIKGKLFRVVRGISCLDQGEF